MNKAVTGTGSMDQVGKNDLSWSSILVMPPNLLSFCLASTYDVLPSPRNLKHWRISTECSCFLCGKDVPLPMFLVHVKYL